MQASTRFVLIGFVALAQALLLTGCPRPIRPTEPTRPVSPEAVEPARGSTSYLVVPRDSRVDIYVYRGGTFSKLGHNHVVTSNALHGRVWVHPQFERSGFELSFPVQELTVDDPAARKAAGNDFPPDVPAADKEGTRKNMLRAEVLDAERYPNVTLRSVRISGSAEAPQILARITIKDASREVQVPTKVQVQGNRLSAQGEFDILQTEFGIKPFSVGLGALQVQDRLHIRYSIVAERGGT
jgi:polyisoprenoid-binding protein YceI